MGKQETLTQRQNQAYELLKRWLSDKGKAPTVAEIAQEMLVSLRTAAQYLEALQRKELIFRERYVKRGIRLLEDNNRSETVLVPVFASAGCGDPSVIAERIFDEFISVSTEITDGRDENLFIIKAIGDSMRDAGINSGDYVLVERTENISPGDIVVAIIDDTAVIKKIIFADNAIILKPVSDGPEYKPIILSRNFSVFGKVITTIKVETPDEYQYIPENNEK